MEDWGAVSYDWPDVQRHLSKLEQLQDLPVHILPLFRLNSSWQATWISSPLAVIVLQQKHRLTACTELVALLPGKLPAVPWGMRRGKARERTLWNNNKQEIKKAMALPPRTSCSSPWVGIIQIKVILYGQSTSWQGTALSILSMRLVSHNFFQWDFVVLTSN